MMQILKLLGDALAAAAELVELHRVLGNTDRRSLCGQNEDAGSVDSILRSLKDSTRGRLVELATEIRSLRPIFLSLGGDTKPLAEILEAYSRSLLHFVQRWRTNEASRRFRSAAESLSASVYDVIALLSCAVGRNEELRDRIAQGITDASRVAFSVDEDISALRFSSKPVLAVLDAMEQQCQRLYGQLGSARHTPPNPSGTLPPAPAGTATSSENG